MRPPKCVLSATVLFATASIAFADYRQSGDWTSMFGQGVLEITNKNKTGDTLQFECGSVHSGYDVEMEFSSNTFVNNVLRNFYYDVDGKKYEDDFRNPASKDAADRFIAFQKSILTGKVLTVYFQSDKFEGERKAVFSLRGAKQVFYDEPCQPKYGKEALKERSKYLLQVPDFCEKKWKDDYVQLVSCAKNNGPALVDIESLKKKYNKTPDLISTINKCTAGFTDKDGYADYIQALNCARRQISAYEEIHGTW